MIKYVFNNYLIQNWFQNTIFFYKQILTLPQQLIGYVYTFDHCIDDVCVKISLTASFKNWDI